MPSIAGNSSDNMSLRSQPASDSLSTRSVHALRVNRKPSAHRALAKRVTDERSNEITSIYQQDLARSGLLRAEEEVELAIAIEVGLMASEVLRRPPTRLMTRMERRDLLRLVREGESAFDRFARCNLRLVASVANHYQGPLSYLDAVQEGAFGLIRAIQKWDYRLGYKFSTYANWWIRQSITRAVADQSQLIRLPVHRVERDRPILAERRRLDADGMPASPEAIANSLGLAVSQVTATIDRHTPPVSLEWLRESHVAIVDPAEDDALLEPTERRELAAQVQLALGHLKPREAEVIRLRFGLDDDTQRTLEQIGAMMGVSRERIRQIESKALKQLRSHLTHLWSPPA